MGLLEVLLGVCVCGAESDGLRGLGYVVNNLDDHPAILVRLDEELRVLDVVRVDFWRFSP